MQQDATKLKKILQTEMLRLKPINAMAFVLPAAVAGGVILLLLHPLLGYRTNAPYAIAIATAAGVFLGARRASMHKHKFRLENLCKTLFSPDGRILPVAIRPITTNPTKTRKTVEITNADGCFALVPLKRWLRISERLKKEAIQLETLSQEATIVA